MGMEGRPLRMGVVCSWFPGWGLTSAAFGSTLSWVKIEGVEVEGVKSLFPAEVCWKTADGIEEEWSEEQYDAEIVCFEDKWPGPTHQVWRLPSLKLVVWNQGSGRLKPPSGWKLQVLKGDHQTLGGVTATTHVTRVATREGNSNV